MLDGGWTVRGLSGEIVATLTIHDIDATVLDVGWTSSRTAFWTVPRRVSCSPPSPASPPSTRGSSSGCSRGAICCATPHASGASAAACARRWTPTCGSLDAADPAPMTEADLVRAVTELLPERSVGITRRVPLRRAVEFVIGDDALPRPVAIRVPVRADAFPEAIAALADTTVSVLRRFPVGVHRISCQSATWGMTKGRHGGVTDPRFAVIYLHPLYVLVDDRERALRDALTQPPSPRASARVPAPSLAVDGTIAHELWHVIEAASHGPRAFAGVEFHRLLGEALGVATLEHALRGAEAGAPDGWRAAHARLVDEVSAYATTNPREAKAEMFKLWWCRSGPPSPDRGPIRSAPRRVLARARRPQCRGDRLGTYPPPMSPPPSDRATQSDPGEPDPDRGAGRWATATSMEATLDLEQIDRDIFRGVNTAGAEVRHALYGGQVAAQALRAASLTVAPDRFPHSLHGYFLRPGRFDLPVVLCVDRDRDGRSFSARHVTAVQDGEVIFSMLASFHRDEAGGTLDRLPHVPVAPPESRFRSDWAGSARHRRGDHHRHHGRPAAPHRPVCGSGSRRPSPTTASSRRARSPTSPTWARGSDRSWTTRCRRAGRASIMPCGSTTRSGSTTGSSSRCGPTRRVGSRGVYHGTVRDRDGRLGAMLAQEMLLRPPPG